MFKQPYESTALLAQQWLNKHCRLDRQIPNIFFFLNLSAGRRPHLNRELALLSTMVKSWFTPTPSHSQVPHNSPASDRCARAGQVMQASAICSCKKINKKRIWSGTNSESPQSYWQQKNISTDTGQIRVTSADTCIQNWERTCILHISQKICTEFAQRHDSCRYRSHCPLERELHADRIPREAPVWRPTRYSTLHLLGGNPDRPRSGRRPPECLLSKHEPRADVIWRHRG